MYPLLLSFPGVAAQKVEHYSSNLSPFIDRWIKVVEWRTFSKVLLSLLCSPGKARVLSGNNATTVFKRN